MHPARKRGYLLLLALPLLLSSCATPYGNAMRAARRAEKMGNERNALAAYRKACALKDADHRSCERAAELSDSLADAAVAEAAPVCREGRVDQCGIVLRRVAGPAFDHPRVSSLLEESLEAAVKWDAMAVEAVDACMQEPPGDLEAALEALSCIESARAAPLDRPAFDERVDEYRDDLVAPFNARIEDSPPAASYALSTMAACVGRSERQAKLLDDERSAFLRSSSRPLDLRLKWEGSGPMPPSYQGFCERLEAGLTGLYCAGEGSSEALRLVVSISQGDIEYSVHEEAHTVRYQSGVRSEPNPERQVAENRLTRAEYAIAESEPVYHDWVTACESAQRAHRQAGSCFDCHERELRRYNCDRADRAKEAYDRHARELRDAQRELNRSPVTIDVPEYALHQYVDRIHSWELRYRLEVHAPPLAAPKEEANLLQRQSLERQGFEPAGISHETVTVPPPGEFSRFITERALALSVEAAKAAQRLGAPDPADHCGTGDPMAWLDCLAESALAAGRLISAAELMPLLASRLGVDAPLPECE